MVGELAARYVTVKYTDFLQYNQGYTSRCHHVCVCVEGGGCCIQESSFWILWTDISVTKVAYKTHWNWENWDVNIKSKIVLTHRSAVHMVFLGHKKSLNNKDNKT